MFNILKRYAIPRHGVVLQYITIHRIIVFYGQKASKISLVNYYDEDKKCILQERWMFQIWNTPKWMFHSNNPILYVLYT